MAREAHLTVASAVAAARARLATAGVADPERDAERLLRHVLSWDQARLLAHPETPLAPEQHELFAALVAEREKRRPLQHLIGTQAFWRHEFIVTPDVLIPRPETEGLVEAALAVLRGIQRPTLVDVGTGTGCIALSLAAERPDADVHATDLSAAALAVAARNARELGLADRVRFHHGDLLVPAAAFGPFDLVVSNPPYVDPAQRESLQPEVRDYEPALALFPEGDALAIYRRLLPAACQALKPHAALIVEIGLGMDRDMAALCVQSGFDVVEIVPDLARIPRTLVARSKR